MKDILMICNDPDCECEDKCCQECQEKCLTPCENSKKKQKIYESPDFMVEQLDKLGESEDCWLIAVAAEKIRSTIEEIARLRELLVKIEKRCDSIDSDCHEGDKVRCHSEWIRFEIAKVYPKCCREERKSSA